MKFTKNKYPLPWRKMETVDIKEEDLTNHNVINFLRKFMSHLHHKEEIRMFNIREADKLIKEFLEDYK